MQDPQVAILLGQPITMGLVASFLVRFLNPYIKDYLKSLVEPEQTKYVMRAIVILVCVGMTVGSNFVMGTPTTMGLVMQLLVSYGTASANYMHFFQE